MKKITPFILSAVFGLLLPAAKAGPSAPARPFIVFDNLHYAGKPDTAAFGISNCNIVYGKLWPAPKRVRVDAPQTPGTPEVRDDAKLPDAQTEAPFKAEVLKNSQLPGPIVLDFEAHRLSGKSQLVLPHFQAYETLVRWTKEAAPGHAIGYYGHGLFPEEPGPQYKTEAAQLAATFDAFFPSLYVFDDNRQAWEKKARALVEQAHRVAPGKPVYFYIWPQYHDGNHPKALQFVSGDYWRWQLETARSVGADGVVMWSGVKPAWNPEAAWWQATLKFMAENKVH